MKDANKDELMKRAKSIITLNLLAKVLIKLAKEKDVAIVGKLQALYVTKGLDIHLYMFNSCLSIDLRKAHPSEPTLMSLQTLDGFK